MQNPVRCWAPEGFRPRVKLQRVREYTHVYSAVCPIDGDSFSLILPYANTEMMTIFLREFSEYSQNYRIVMVMDGASWHKSKELELFDNIEKTTEIYIYNSLGLLIKKTFITSYKTVIKNSDYSQGLYYYQVNKNNNKISSGKFLVIK